MRKRLCLLLGILLILTAPLSTWLRAEEDVGIDIQALEYDPVENPHEVIIVLEVFGLDEIIDHYVVDLIDKEFDESRRTYNVPVRVGSNRIKIVLPQSLPSKTYWLQVEAFDEAGYSVSTVGTDFVYTGGNNSNAVPQGVIYAALFGGVVMSVAAGSVVYRRKRPLHKPAHTLVTHPAASPVDDGTVSVFLSYSRQDWDQYASPLVERLRSEGVHVWVDQHTIDSGDDWMDEINEALQQSECLVLCVSPEALASKYVKMEYRYFISENKPILPVLCREADFPAELRGIQYVTYDSTDEIIDIIKQRNF
jgi:hypothetical protein